MIAGKGTVPMRSRSKPLKLLRGKVKAVTVSVKNKLCVSRGDSNAETVFELLLVANSKNIAVVVFPRECDMFN